MSDYWYFDTGTVNTQHSGEKFILYMHQRGNTDGFHLQCIPSGQFGCGSIKGGIQSENQSENRFYSSRQHVKLYPLIYWIIFNGVDSLLVTKIIKCSIALKWIYWIKTIVLICYDALKSKCWHQWCIMF